MENMIDSCFNFLDTTIISKNRQLNLEDYRKPTATDCMINHKTGVSFISTKLSSFVGELYRIHHSTTTVSAENIAIKNSKKIYIKKYLPLTHCN